jgi:hypothetical protein
MAKKIRSRGASIAAAYQNQKAIEHAEADFRKRLNALCPGHSFDDQMLDRLYLKLGYVNGKWLSEWGQPEVLPIARRLASSARFLEDLVQGLAGIQTGMRQSEDIEFAILTREAIKRFLSPEQKPKTRVVADLRSRERDDPLLTRADEKLASFQQQCSEMAHAFWVAFRMLKEERGKAGRKELDWYDDFTELLLEIAQLANIEPNLHKDRSTGERGGWLFQAAQALEYFLYPPMRSPSPEACGKRLERSLKRLKQRHRQIGTKRKSFMSM